MPKRKQLRYRKNPDGLPKCLNPGCKREFTPGRYGRRQKICGRKSCKDFYRSYWVQVRKPPRGIPDPVFSRIRAEAQRRNPRKKALIVVTRETGMRKGEVLGLTWGDLLDHAGKVKGEVALRGQWDDREGFKPTKTANSRLVYLSEMARKELGKLGRGEPENRVFPYWESSVYTWFVGIQKDLGITNPETGYPYRFHDLRHSLGVELGKKGRLDLVQKMLGHKNIQTSTIYTERTGQEIIDEVAAVRRGKRKRNRRSRGKRKRNRIGRR